MSSGSIAKLQSVRLVRLFLTPSFTELAKETVQAYGDDGISREAAALAYFTMFAFAPLLVVLIEIVGLALGGHGHLGEVRDAILRSLQPSLGKQETAVVGRLVESTFKQSHKEGIVASILSWIVLLVAATGLFGAIQGALDTIWHVKREQHPWWTLIRERLVSFALIAGVACLVIVYLAVNTAIGIVGRYIASEHVGHAMLMVSGVNFVISLAVITVLFGAMFKFLPHVDLQWSDVMHGALASAVLFMIGQLALSWYLTRAGTASAFGAAGSLVVLVLWIYYSGQIFLMGAVFTKVFAQRHGSRQTDLQQ